jgi:hypothetical protein
MKKLVEWNRQFQYLKMDLNLFEIKRLKLVRNHLTTTGRTAVIDRLPVFIYVRS